ncbi:hypothetical protein [Moorella sp. Hama-1]|uniref:hypothetical protein n=1 Tax=Moorella sp. Hama-1 TaxID=2138101 RepID=UPI000D6425A7|nr:hypothetical protein [Moorella sp. Hama-1]MDN5362291.1 hypothetical protein [Moorella sp. (in: firmicutes)]BCV22881.1 hypothetical protein hamaS1_29500 [Moorella sp. Hama-1]
MSLATCSCQCTYYNDGLCELASHLDQGQPVICPYQQPATASARPGPPTPGWEGLPPAFTTTRHHRYPGPTAPVARQR